MALFAKKDKAASANTTKASNASQASGAKKGLKFGRNKDAPAPSASSDANPGAASSGGFEDFSDFSTEPQPAAAAPAAYNNGSEKARKAKPKGLKGGSVVGLNIGNDSIKAIEIRGKGENVAVTAMGMVPTPPDSISNGVVMSTTALSHAIRELFQKSGIKTKRVVTSVAGTGALVVRVIEVPKVSDNELKHNMAVDADRYIPFPPTEVILDFKALRELPTDPDSPNMEVLLAAAQREIVDLHVNVLMNAKLDPQAIDVEPLAASRALHYDGLSGGNNEVDYSDVSALVNIGATSTEISVLRGNVLVFTRSIPRGGNILSETLAAELDLNIFDAERLKRESGDALPPFGSTIGAGAAGAAVAGSAATAAAASAAAATAAAEEDWGDFGSFDEPEAASETAGTPYDIGADFDIATPGTSAGSAAGSTDPFDLDFFNQGPQNDEPQEQHQQSEPPSGSNPHPFDFSDFSLDEARAAADNLPSQNSGSDDEDEFANIISVSDGDSGRITASSTTDWHTAEHPEELAPTGQMFHFDTIDDPSLPSFPTLPTHLTEGLNEPIDDFAGLPTIADTSTSSTTSAPEPAFAQFDEPGATETPTAEPVVAGQPVTAESAPAESAPVEPAPAGGFSFNFEAAEPIDLGAPAASEPVEEFAAIPESETASPSYSLGDEPESVPGLATQGATAVSAASTTPSAFDFGDVAVPQESSVAATSADLPDDYDTSDDAFDIDSIVGPGDDFAAGVGAAGIGAAGVGAAGVGAAPIADIFGDTTSPGASAADDFGSSFDNDFGDLSSFGAALTGNVMTAGISPERVHEVLAPLLDELVGEVRRSLEYYASRFPDSGVRHISLVGGGAMLTNIDAYFTQSLGIPTTRGNVFSNIVVRVPQLPAGYADENSSLYAVALGLALRDLT